jgi:hypothetical protein
MGCLICKDLERTLDFRRSKYFEARSAAYYRVSTELAASKNVDMERAKSALDEHRLVCRFAGLGETVLTEQAREDNAPQGLKPSQRRTA